MIYVFFAVILLLRKVPTESARIDNVECGIDHNAQVFVGDIDIGTYAWLGILYYNYDEDTGEIRSVTPVALIHEEFVVGAAADIGEMPKHNFRQVARVLLGEDWEARGRNVRNYVIHPEYGQTFNTLALVHLAKPVKRELMRPLCPAPAIIRDPDFYVVRFKENYDELKKEVIPVAYVPGNMCKDFYSTANLYQKKMRPPYVACAASLETNKICVWEAGAVLVMRDVWRRWQLLGFGVRGPGCGAPSRYLDMMSYYPWVHATIDKFRRLTITKIHNQKYVLRSSGELLQRFGACDPEERINLMYREVIVLRTDNPQYQFMTYNLTILQNVEMTCLTLEMVNASGSSQMRIRHKLPRRPNNVPCHYYELSSFEISIYLIFSDKCLFEMFAYGFTKTMMLLDIMEWKWEEATYYKDFALEPDEYRGQYYMTGFGFEPLDIGHWVPEYDLWTTTEFDNSSWSSTTPLPDREQTGSPPASEGPPTRLITTRKTKKTLKPAVTTCDVHYAWFQPVYTNCKGILKIHDKYSTTTLKPTSKWRGK